MKETVKEYLEELKEREAVDAEMAEEAFNKFLETEKAKVAKFEAEDDSQAAVDAREAFAKLEKQLTESKDKGESVQKYGARIMEQYEQAEKAAKMKEIKFDVDAEEKSEEPEEKDNSKEEKTDSSSEKKNDDENKKK